MTKHKKQNNDPLKTIIDSTEQTESLTDTTEELIEDFVAEEDIPVDNTEANKLTEMSLSNVVKYKVLGVHKCSDGTLYKPDDIVEPSEQDLSLFSDKFVKWLG